MQGSVRPACGADIGKRAVAVVAQQLRVAHPADEQIRIAIVVVVAPRRADGRKHAAHTRLAR